MAKGAWHEGSASIIILPGGDDGERLLDIVQEWTSCWMLKPSFWVRSEDVISHAGEQTRVKATIIARNARREIDLLDYLSGVDLKQVRLLAIRTIDSESQHDQVQEKMIDIISDVLSHARPYNVLSEESVKNQTYLMKINLIFAPSKRKGASYSHLLASSWDINLIIAPEDRSTPSRFDKSTFDSIEDKDKWLRFVISNTSVAAGIWTGQEKSIFEAASQFADLSPVQGQVKIMRSFVRGILSEGLATRIAADALNRIGNAKTSKLNALRPFPNQFLEAYEDEREVQIIDNMVNQAIEFSGGRLKYKKVQLVPDEQQEDTGVFAALKYFFKTTWSLFKVLPLWIFASIWNQIAIVFSRLIFGFRGRKRIVGTIDFPRTDLDKDAEVQLQNIQELRAKILAVSKKWPSAVARKSEPILWSDLRKLMLGRLDASSLPTGIDHESGTNGKKIIGDLNHILPDMNERWELPADIERSVASQIRSTNWQQDENIMELSNFFSNSVSLMELQVSTLKSKQTTIADLKLAKEAELDSVFRELEVVRSENLLKSIESDSVKVVPL